MKPYLPHAVAAGLMAACLCLPLEAQAKKKATPKPAPSEDAAKGETEQTPEKGASKTKPAKIQWDGEWNLLADDSDNLEPLIEAHIKDQNFAMKALWKRRLQSACKSPKTLDILAGADGFSVTMDKEVPAECPLDGGTNEWKRSDGEIFRISLKQDGPRMTQRFQGDGYTITQVYSMRKSGETLALQVTYEHPKLNAFSYKLVYKRAE